METALRYVLMLKLLPVYPRKTTASELRDKLVDHYVDFDISTRSVQRDLVKLASVFHLISDEHKPRGWSRMRKPHEMDEKSADHQILSRVA